ncbi:hypothetical protein [Occallatibacter riparius]|uniref:Uncharacterized protein n=1 Tax=Occallatibacter riparius TaxID=1002689 RepID=A0A9J7BGC0_9BACT|nr:hypothetical protein [Occallatibacter riparius]UWZ81832.1 hypothetical protein MOP44_14695 [Occallatibacter riparius]
MDIVEDMMRSVELTRLGGADCEELHQLELALIDALPRAAMQPPETRVLKRNGRETRFMIDGNPCTLEQFKAYAKGKGIDAAKLEQRIGKSAGEREQITTRSAVQAE